MRSEGIIKFLGICAVAVAIGIMLNVTALHAVRRQYAPGTAFAASLFNISGQFHEWLGYIVQWKHLANENAILRASTNKYITIEAMVQSLQAENDLLRKSAGLTARFQRRMLPAGIFNISLTPSGYRALINKGQQDGIALGQAVISPDGMLVGTISAIFFSSSQVMLVEDPDFSVTVKVLGGQTTGILRGALSEGLDLNLITQSDQITEGDTLITTGDDLIPAGLVAGMVRNVQNNDTQLFKKVNVNPAMNPSQGAVIVVQQ